MKLGGIIILILVDIALATTVEEHCRNREGASEEDAAVLREHRPPETRIQKCYFDCVFQFAGYSDGRRFQRESFLKRAYEQAGNDEVMKAELDKTADRCEGVENEDRCELAAELDACLMNR